MSDQGDFCFLDESKSTAKQPPKDFEFAPERLKKEADDLLSKLDTAKIKERNGRRGGFAKLENDLYKVPELDWFAFETRIRKMMHEIIEPLTQKQFRTFDGLDKMNNSIKEMSAKYEEISNNVTRVVEKNEIYHDVQQYCRQLEDDVVDFRNLLKSDIQSMDQKLETWGARWRATQTDVNSITRVEDKVILIQRQISDIMEKQKDNISQKINALLEDGVKQQSENEKKYRVVYKELQDMNVKVMSMRDATQQYDIRFKKSENQINDIKETLDNQRFATSHGEKLHQMEKKLFQALKSQSDMALSKSQTDRIQGLIFESQKGMIEQVFNLNANIENINTKNTKPNLINYIDWQIECIKQTKQLSANDQQSDNKSADDYMQTQSEFNLDQITKLENAKLVIQEKIEQQKQQELEEIELQEQELQAFKSKHPRGSAVNKRLSTFNKLGDQDSLAQQVMGKRRATTMGKNVSYMPILKSSTLLKHKKQNDSITEYDQEDDKNSLREEVAETKNANKQFISAKEIQTINQQPQKNQIIEKEEEEMSEKMQLDDFDSDSPIASQRKTLIKQRASGISSNKKEVVFEVEQSEEEAQQVDDKQIEESEDEVSEVFYIEEQQFEDYKLYIEEQFLQFKEQSEQNALSLQEQIDIIQKQQLIELQNEIVSVKDQIQIVKEYDIEQLKIVLSGSQSKSFQLIREEFFSEVNAIKETSNKLYENFREMTNKIESEQKKIKRERADQILMLERFVKDTIAISEESQSIIEMMRNLSYIIAILVEVHNIQIAKETSKEADCYKQGVSQDVQQIQEASVVYKGRRFQKAYLLQLKKVLLETEWGSYLAKEPFSQIFGQNNPSFYEVISQKLNRYISDPQGYVDSFLMESQFSKLSTSQHQQSMVKEIPQEIIKIKNVYEARSKKKQQNGNKHGNTKMNNQPSQDFLLQSSVDSMKNNTELLIEGYNDKVKKIHFEVYQNQNNKSVIGQQSARSKSPIDQRLTPYQQQQQYHKGYHSNNNYVMPEIIHQNTSTKTRNSNNPSFSNTQQLKNSQQIFQNQEFHEQLDSNISYQNNKKKEGGAFTSFNRASASSSYNIQNLDLIPRFKAPLKNSILTSKLNQIPIKGKNIDHSPNVVIESPSSQPDLNKSANIKERSSDKKLLYQQNQTAGYGSFIQATGKPNDNSQFVGSLNVAKKNITSLQKKQVL